MISKLPQWVWIYAGVLAFIAGIVNVVGFLSFEHQAITHLTGTTSLLGAAIATADIQAIFHLLAVLGAFIFGAMLSGVLIKDSTLRLGRRYGLVLLIEALFLFLAVPFLNAGMSLGIYLAGGACGLQNAMASTYSGTVIRTSHVTGMFTDLGIFLGHVLIGLPIEKRRLHLSLIVISAFLAGGILGGIAFRSLGYSTLYIPANIALAVALIYVIYRRIARKKLHPE